MIKETLVKYLTGHFTRAGLKKRFLPVIIIIIFTFLVIAYLFYPPELNYSFFSDTISGLGDFVENPNGWWGFSIAIWTLSTSFFSLFLYMHRRLGVICRKTARFGSFFTLVGCICLFCIGIIVDAGAPLVGSLTFTKVHMIFVYGGFGGLAIGVVTYGFIFMKDTFPRLGGQQIIPRYRPLPPYAIILGLAAGGMGVSQLLKEIYFPESGWNGPGLLSVSFWEWMLLFGIIMWVFWIALILPEQIPERPSTSTP